jgi:hypothetical protein
MLNDRHASPVTTTSAKTGGRYLSTRVDPPSPPFVCTGETVDQMRHSLQRSGERGRYVVFDRQPAVRGIEAELIGQFIVEDGGAVQWKALPSGSPE